MILTKHLKKITYVVLLFVSFATVKAQECMPKISSPVSYSDWISNAKNVGSFPIDSEAIMMSPAGIDAMMDLFVTTGIKRIYWRIYNGGAVTFDAGHPEIGLGNELYTATDYGFDFVAIDDTFYNEVGKSNIEYAIEQADNRGIDIFAWFTLAEEMHSGNCPMTKYAENKMDLPDADDYFEYGLNANGNLERWKGRLNFANTTVRTDKVEMIRMLSEETFRFDGIFLDFTRRGLKDFISTDGTAECGDLLSIYNASNPYTTSTQVVRDRGGISIFGYDDISLNNYPYGSPSKLPPNGDIGWINHRADVWTTFMQDLNIATSIPIIPHVFGTDAKTTRKGDLLDWKKWLEEDYIDGISFLIMNTDDGIMLGGDWNALPDPLTKANTVIKDRKTEVFSVKPEAEVITSIYLHWRAWGMCPNSCPEEKRDYDTVEEFTAYAYEAEPHELMIWESNGIYLYEENYPIGDFHRTNTAVTEFGAGKMEDITISGNSTSTTGSITKQFNNDKFNLYVAKNSISIDDYEIEGDGNSYFIACNEIDFHPDFVVNSTGEFTAMISDVPQSSGFNGGKKHAGVNESLNEKSNPKFILYPNPSKAKFTIQLLEDYKSVGVEVYNSMGNNIQTFKEDKQSITIDLSNYKDGIYFVKIKVDENTYSRKIIKN